MINDHHVAALPIAIRHIDFARELSEEPVIGRDEFIVLWHCDWPVGQFLGRDTPDPAARLRDRVPPDVHARAAAGVALERAGRPTTAARSAW